MEGPQHRTIISGFGSVEATVGFACGPCQCSGRYSDQLRNLLAAMPGAAVSVLEDVFERAYVFEQKLADLHSIVLLCVTVHAQYLEIARMCAAVRVHLQRKHAYRSILMVAARAGPAFACVERFTDLGRFEHEHLRRNFELEVATIGFER